jgi:hypothetical protein
MINIPNKAFFGGFADIVPQKLSYYQKNNTNYKNNGTVSIYQKLISYLNKIMNIFTQLDTLKQKQLIH